MSMSRILHVLVCRPVVLQSNEVMESAVISGKAKLSEVNLDIPNLFNVLDKSDAWISNTGTSSHSTNNKSSAKHKRQFDNKDN